MFPVGGIFQLVGWLLMGIAVVAVKRWDGWQRFAPLLQGLSYLVLSIPIVVADTGNRRVATIRGAFSPPRTLRWLPLVVR